MTWAWLLIASLAFPAGAQVTLEGVDVYGTSRLTVEDAKARYAKVFADVTRLKGRRAKGADKSAAELLRKTEEQIRTEWKFAWARLTWHDFYADGGQRGFITIDVVEPADKAARLNFKKPPTQTLPDPGGLLAEWDRYMELGWSLFKQGQLSVTHDACLSFFCEWGAQTPELRAYEEKFIAQAKDHKDALVKVMRGDKAAAKRANAVYLLSYLPDANESSKLLADALDDPEADVRGAALRVYADYAVHHKSVFLPIMKLQASVDFPTADDRKKAMAVVAGMASNADHKRFLITKVGRRMLNLLQSQQPGMGDTAWAALGILSGESFDRRDTVSWERWLERAIAQEASGEPAVKTP